MIITFDVHTNLDNFTLLYVKNYMLNYHLMLKRSLCRRGWKVANVWVFSSSRVPRRAKCTWPSPSRYSLLTGLYLWHVSLSSMGWLWSACRGENETLSLNQTGIFYYTIIFFTFYAVCMLFYSLLNGCYQHAEEKTRLSVRIKQVLKLVECLASVGEHNSSFLLESFTFQIVDSTNKQELIWIIFIHKLL